MYLLRPLLPQDALSLVGGKSPRRICAILSRGKGQMEGHRIGLIGLCPRQVPGDGASVFCQRRRAASHLNRRLLDGLKILSHHIRQRKGTESIIDGTVHRPTEPVRILSQIKFRAGLVHIGLLLLCRFPFIEHPNGRNPKGLYRLRRYGDSLCVLIGLPIGKKDHRDRTPQALGHAEIVHRLFQSCSVIGPPLTA